MKLLKDYNAKITMRYLEESPVTIKGHLKKTKKNVRLTHPKRKRTKAEIIKQYKILIEDVIPKEEKSDANQVFCAGALTDVNTMPLYVDATGSFPYHSLSVMTAVLVFYGYTTNSILVRGIKDQKNVTIREKNMEVFTYLKGKGFKPQFNVMGNQASRVIPDYLKEKNGKWKFVEPHNHRVTVAEHLIQTYKDYFISALCTTTLDFLIQLWDLILPQAHVSLNMVSRA